MLAHTAAAQRPGSLPLSTGPLGDRGGRAPRGTRQGVWGTPWLSWASQHTITIPQTIGNSQMAMKTIDGLISEHVCSPEPLPPQPPAVGLSRVTLHPAVLVTPCPECWGDGPDLKFKRHSQAWWQVALVPAEAGRFMSLRVAWSTE